MTNDEMIAAAIKEINASDTLFKMFDEFSFMKGIKPTDSEYHKIKYRLAGAVPFEKHGEFAYKLSHTGLLILDKYKGDWFAYQKAMKPKPDYIRIGTFIIACIAVIATIYFGLTNNGLNNQIQELKGEQKILNHTIDSIIKSIKYCKIHYALIQP